MWHEAIDGGQVRAFNRAVREGQSLYARIGFAWCQVSQVKRTSVGTRTQVMARTVGSGKWKQAAEVEIR